MATINVLSAPTTANHVISVPIILTDHLTVDIAAGTYGLNLSGALSGSGKTLTKTGSGPLTLSGSSANTYSGLTEIVGGTLNLNKTAGVNAISSGGLQIDSNTTAILLASNQISDSATVTVNGTFSLGSQSETIAILAGGGAVSTGTGSVLTLSSAANSTFLGIISGTGGLAKNGAGTLTLNGTNTYTGGTAINGGTLQVGADHNLGGSGNLTFGGGTLLFSNGFTSARNLTLNTGGGTLDNSNNAVTLTGLVSGSGTLTKSGSGTVLFTSSNSYTGATIISNGILQISNASALGITGAGTTVHAGGELELSADVMTLNEALTLNGGSLCSGIGTNTHSGSLTLTDNSELDVDSTKLIITSGIIQSGGSYGLTKNGPGIVELRGTNTYSGETHIQAGTLSLFNGAAISNSGSVVLHNVAGATLQLNANETIGSLSGGGSTGGYVVLGSNTLATGDASDTIFAGVISGDGGSLTKLGAGTMTLSGNNSYSGSTTITGGAISVAASSALGLEANNLSIGSGATLKASESFTTSRATTLGGSGSGVGGTFDVAAGKTLDYTSSSAITGSGSMIKTGAGTLFLEGTNPFTGGLYIQAGTLAANSQEALGAVPSSGSSLYGLHLYDGATFQTQVGSWTTYRQLELVGNLVGSGGVAKVDVTGSNTHQRNGVISGAGKLDLVGTGTLILTASNTYAGGTLIENGILQVANSTGSATGSGAVTVANGGTLLGSTTASKGFITGTVEMQSGARLLALSGGTLTLGGLTLDAGSLSTFQLGALTSTSLVNVTGSDLFTLSGSGASTINIVNTGLMGTGTYSLFNYLGSAFTDLSALTLANAHSGLFNLSLVNNTSNTSIDLDVTAISQQWKKGDSNTNWSTAGNWWTSEIPDGAGAAAAFINNNGTAGFGTTETVTIDTSTKTVGTLAFQNSNTAFTISASSSQTLTLNNNGVDSSIQVFSTPSTANHTISAPLILLDPLTVDIAAGTYGLNISGDISGDSPVTKTGTGPLTLSGATANTYNGLMQVVGGTLNLNKTASIDAIASGGLQIDTGATAILLASNQIADSATVTVNGTFSLGTQSETIAILAGGGEVSTGTGSLLTLSSATHSTFLGIISGTGGIAKNGAGTLTLNGTNSYTGGTAINGGTLQVGADHNLGGSGNLTFGGGTLLFSSGFTSTRNLALNSGGGTLDTSGSEVTLTGTISGTGPLTKDGAGTVLLTSANSYTGETIINNGILQINNVAALGTTGAGTTIHAGGEIEINGNGLTLTEALTFDGGSLCNLSGTNTYSGTPTLTDHSELDADGGTLSITSGISESGGSYGLTKNGPGIVEFRGTNTYSGETHIQAGTLSLFNGAAISNSGSVVLHNVAGATLQLNANETIGSLTGGGSTGGNVVLGSNTLTTGDASDTTFAGVLSGNGGSLTKLGAGTMTLSGNNSYTGSTTITGGALSIATSSALGLESNNLTIGSGATLKASDSFTTSRATTLGGSGSGVGGTFEVATGKTLDYTSSSAITGSGSLIKTGAGTLFLEGTNPFTGGLYIKAGTLAANSQEALGAVPSSGSSLYGLHLYDGATFQTQVGSWSTYRQLELVGDLVGTGGVAKVDVTGSNTHQRNGVISGAGKLDLVGTGTLILTASNTYTGGTLIENGVLQVANSTGSATSSGAVTIANGGTLLGSTTAGKGFITGTVAIQSGGTVSAFSGETLTLGGLTLGAGSFGTFQLGALTDTSMIDITGENLFIRPSSSTATFNIVNTGAMAIGTYRLLDYTGTAFTDISTLALADAMSGLFNLSLVNNTGNTSIDLDVSAIATQWRKGGSNTNWSDAANWWTGAVPDGIGVEALFLNNNGNSGFESTETVTLDSSKTVGEIVFQNTASVFTINAPSGQTLTLNESGGGATISVLQTPASANHVINAPLILADNLTVDLVSGSYGLDLSGAISGIDKTLTKTGAGPLTLSGAIANTYTGLTEVVGGTLNLNKTAGVDAISSGGLQIDTDAAAILLASNQIADSATVTINGTFSLGTHSETITMLAGGGEVSTGTDSLLTLSSASDSTFLGIISGTGGIAKDGAGTLTLNGTNSYTGGTAIHGGTLQVGANNNLGGTGDLTFGGGTLLFSNGFSSARNLTLNSGGGTLDTNGNNSTLTGTISGTGTLAKLGAGTLTLSGTNTYTGETTLSGGVLSIASNSNLGAIATGATLNLNDGATLQTTASIALNNSGSNSRNIVVGNGGGTLETLTSGHTLTVSGIISGTGHLTTTGEGTLLLTGSNTLSGAVTINAGNTLQQGNGGAGGSLSNTSGITNNGSLIFNRSGTHLYTNVISGSGSFTKDGSSTLTLTGVNTYSGSTTISGGTLQIGDGVSDGSIASSSGITNNSALIYQVAGTDSFAQIISGSGTLTKSGPGALTLSGTNTYTGITTISGGTLSIAADSALGTAPGTPTSGQLVLNGGTLAATETFTLDSKRGITSGGSLDVASNKTLTYGGSAAGTGTLTKTGAGTLILTGANSYTGGTTISSGTLQIGDGTTNGSLAANSAITADGTLNYHVVGSQTAALSISGSGTVTKSGSGTLIFIGQSSFGGTVTIDAGTLQIGNGTYNGSLGNATSITNNGTLVNKNNVANSTFSRVLGGTGAFIMDAGSANTLTMSGANTYEGLTTITSGTLKLGNTTALGTTATGTTVSTGAALDLSGQTLGAEAMTINGTGIASGGALINSDGTAASLSGNITLAANSSVGGSGEMTLSGEISGSSKDLTKIGSGILNLSGINSYTGATTLSGGTLNITGSLDSGSNVSVASGATLLGTGTIGGTVTVATGTAAIIAGNGASGTLSISGGLIFDGTGTIHIGALTNYTSSTALAVTDALTLYGGAGEVTLALPNGGVSNGTYHLIGHSNTLADLTGFSVTGPDIGGRQTATLKNHTSMIDYVVSGAIPYWSGIQSTEWSTNTIAGSKNWSLDTNNAPTDFLATDTVLFNNSATGTTADITVDDVTPVSVSVSGSKDFTFTGTKAIAGAGSLTIDSTGSLTISTENTFSGGTSLNAGTLMLGTATALGSGTVTLNGGTLSSDSTDPRSLANHLILGGDVTLGNATNSGLLTFSDTDRVDLGGATRILTTASDVTLSGFTNGALTKDGAGTLTLTVGNNTTGNTTLLAGTLEIGAVNLGFSGSSALIFAGNSTLRVMADIPYAANRFEINDGVTATIDTDYHIKNGGVISGGGGLTKTGSGTVTLTGQNSYTGMTTVSQGTLQAGDGTTDGYFGGGGITNNATLIYNNNAATLSYGLDISGTGTFTKQGTGNLTFTNAMTYTGATIISTGTLQLGDGITDGTISSSSSITNNSALLYNLIGTSSYSNVISGTGILTKAGAGTLTLSDTNTYTGVTTISGGTLHIAADSGLGTAPGTATAGKLVLNGGALATTATMTLNSNRGITTGGTLDVASGTTLSYGGIAAGTGTLTKSGSGILTLSGINTYTGATMVNGGTLNIATDNALGTAPSDITAEHLVLNGSTLAATDTFTLDSNRGLQLATTSTLDVANDKTLTYSGVVAGLGGLNKSGSGTLELLGRNKFSGTITHNAGTMVINSSLSLGSYVEGETNGELIFAGNATLKLAADVNSARSYVFNEGATATIDTDGHTLEQSGVFSGSVALTKTGSGTLTLTGLRANTYSGLTTVNTGELNLNQSAGTLAVSGNLTIGDGTGGANADVVRLQASGQILSSAAVLINGTSGMLDLNGNSQVIGSLADSGTVTANGSSVALGTAGALTVGDASSTSFSGVISGTNGTLTKQGSGTLTLSGTNTYTGTTAVDVGILVINGDQHLASGAVSVVGALAGTGIVGGATTINSTGIHSPGEVGAVGTQEFSSNLTYAAGSIFEWNLAAANTSTGFDKVTGAADKTFDATGASFHVITDLDFSAETFWETQKTWSTIFTGFSTLTGWNAPTAVAVYNTAGTERTDVADYGSFSVSGPTLTWNYSPVPEPTTALAVLLLGAGMLRRRRN